MRNLSILAALILAMSFSFETTAIQAAPPSNWSPVILPTGAYRAQIKSMPIQQRPGRPLHVYGNTVRLIDQSERDMTVRPVRQIFFGTPELRGIRTNSRRR